jgi:hypothetical protein
MKTTLNLNDVLLTHAKTAATQQRTTLTRLIEEGLRLRLKATVRKRAHRTFPVYHGTGGLAAGLTGLSNKAMFDAVDGLGR